MGSMQIQLGEEGSQVEGGDGGDESAIVSLQTVG